MAVSKLFDLCLILVNFSRCLFDFGFSVRVTRSTKRTKCPLSSGNSWALYKGALSVYILSGRILGYIGYEIHRGFVLI